METGTNSKQFEAESEGSSFRELVLRGRDWLRYFISKKYVIILFVVLGAALGLCYSFFKKPEYSAVTNFVLESGNTNALNAYAGIASGFGIDLGDGNTGLFEGENILELYRSRIMITKALLSEYEFNQKQQLVVNRYIALKNLKQGWKEKHLENINFVSSNQYSSPELQLLHDSIMGQIVNSIRKENLLVEKKDKKLNVVTVTVNSEDELFSKAFNESLVQNVNHFYLETKTKKAEENVAILQRKVDSVSKIMTGAIYTAATVSDATPNQNPTRMTPRVAPIQNARARAEVNQDILGTLLQNLELSKISLLKDTPLIQIVDSPILPLEVSRLGKVKGIVIGGFIAGFLVIVFLILRRKIRSALY